MLSALVSVVYISSHIKRFHTAKFFPYSKPFFTYQPHSSGFISSPHYDSSLPPPLAHVSPLASSVVFLMPPSLHTAFSRCLPSQPSLLPAYPLYWLLLFSFYVEHLTVYKSHWSIRMETNNHSMHQVMILVLILSPLSLSLAI